MARRRASCSRSPAAASSAIEPASPPACLLAVYPPRIFFDGLIQKSSLDLFLVTLLLALLGEFLHKPRWGWLARRRRRNGRA